MPELMDHLQHLIGKITRLSLIGGSALWAWTRLKSDIVRIRDNVSGIGLKVAGEAKTYGSRSVETLSASAQRMAQSAPNTLEIVKKQKEAIMGKPKKKFSFLKFLLVVGAMIALAIFLLDKFLPKPYRDDELEDAWAGEELEPSEMDETEDVASAEEAEDVPADGEEDKD
jgi:hypothetical protein